MSADIFRAFQENKLVHANDAFSLSCPLNWDSRIPVTRKKLLCRSWTCTRFCVIFSLYSQTGHPVTIALQRSHLKCLWCGRTEADLVILQILHFHMRAGPEKLQFSVKNQNKPKRQKHDKLHQLAHASRGIWTSGMKSSLIYWKSVLLRQSVLYSLVHLVNFCATACTLVPSSGIMNAGLSKMEVL